jgi:FtsP/CotA-like multicopper oxidase with cupredoxin domain
MTSSCYQARLGCSDYRKSDGRRRKWCEWPSLLLSSISDFSYGLTENGRRNYNGFSTDRRDFSAIRIDAHSNQRKNGSSDITLRIAPVSLEIAPGKIIRTVGYNGSIPGPILRLKEGNPVTVDVFNETDVPETVHWHGQLIPSAVDGSVDEGTPAVPPHGHRRYRFTPRPAGTRWYHTHLTGL